MFKPDSWKQKKACSDTVKWYYVMLLFLHFCGSFKKKIPVLIALKAHSIFFETDECDSSNFSVHSCIYHSKLNITKPYLKQVKIGLLKQMPFSFSAIFSSVLTHVSRDLYPIVVPGELPSMFTKSGYVLQTSKCNHFLIMHYMVNIF